MEIATIGCSQTSAEHFFERLKKAGVRRVVDVRLHNSSQLAGFAKAPDLDYFVRELLGGAYEHDLRLAPTEEMFANYRHKRWTWNQYSSAYLDLMAERGVPGVLERARFGVPTALVCSEGSPQTCHRRALAELLAESWGATIRHL